MTGVGARIHVGGDVRGQIVVGDHNVTVWAEQSVVTVVQPGERPLPRRRADVTLLPRRDVAPIGREREIDAVRTLITAERLAQVYGPPGSGKSTLARQVCTELTGTSVVFLPAAQRDVTDVLQDVFETCYEAPGYRPGPVELRRLMSDVDIQLVIDDLDVEPEQRDALLDGVPAATVLFTSAHRSVGVQSLALPGLSADAGLALLADGLGRPLRTEEQSLGMELWRATAGSPLMLLRAAAAARPAQGSPGITSLPRPAELVDLLPRVVAGLSGPARDCASVLALAGSAAVSAGLLPWLVADLAMAVPAIDELLALGVALQTETGYQLAPGVDSVVAAGADPVLVARLAARLRDWAGMPGQRPPDVADNAPFIGMVIDAAVATGNAGLGAALARTVAPMMACSLRLGAWGRILGRGKVAAEQAGDRSTLAYLTHEDGILSLITGRRVAAVAAVGAAIAIWHELGDTAHLAVAQHTQALAGSVGGNVGTSGPVHTAGQVAGHHGAAATVHAVGTKTVTAKAATVGAKTGLGLAAKLGVAAVVTAAAVGGGYVVVHTVTTPHPTAAATASTPPTTPATPAEAYCAQSHSGPAIAYTTPTSVVLRCGTGKPVTLGPWSPPDFTSTGLVWSWDGSAVAWMTSDRLNVFRLGTATLNSWDCTGCSGLVFTGDQAVTVTQADEGSDQTAAVPRLLVFPATGSTPPTTRTVSGIQTRDFATEFRVLATISATDIVVDYGDPGGSNAGNTQLLYRVNAEGIATQYGHDSFDSNQTASTIIGALSDFNTDSTGHQLGLTEFSNGGACGGSTHAVLVNTSSGAIALPAAPSGGGSGGYWVEGIWFDRNGTPYVSLIPNESTCTTTGDPSDQVPPTATPTVWKLVDDHWVSAGSGTIQAGDGPNDWTAQLTGTFANGSPSGTSLNLSHSGHTTKIADVTGFEWAPTHRSN